MTAFAGIEHADSLVIDPHKWLYAPFDCAALLYRDPAFARVGAHAGRVVPRRDPRGRHGWNPSDYAYQLTRRARGLPLWFSLAVNGSDAYRDAIEHVLATARAAAARIAALPHLELVREPELSVVLFRREGWAEADYDAWSARLLEEQIAFVAPSRWHGEPVARLAFLHPETTLAIVDEISTRRPRRSRRRPKFEDGRAIDPYPVPVDDRRSSPLVTRADTKPQCSRPSA